MTTKERLIRELTRRGMFDSQAEAVFVESKEALDILVKSYRISWDSPNYDYPNIMHRAFFKAVKPIALAWIEKNKPEAWFKDMFKDTVS